MTRTWTTLGNLHWHFRGFRSIKDNKSIISRVRVGIACQVLKVLIHNYGISYINSDLPKGIKSPKTRAESPIGGGLFENLPLVIL